MVAHERKAMIISRPYALRLLRAGRAANPAPLRADDAGRVYVAIDVYYPAHGWMTRHYLQA